MAHPDPASPRAATSTDAGRRGDRRRRGGYAALVVGIAIAMASPGASTGHAPATEHGAPGSPEREAEIAHGGETEGARDPETGVARDRDGVVPRDLEVVVLTRNDEGVVFCAIWRDAPGFPVERARAAHEAIGRRIEGQRARLRFASVGPGPAALACFHDENANHMLDTSWIGIPSEGTGASNDARGRMGPPRFEDARFEISPEHPGRMTVRMQYGLLGGEVGAD